MSDWKRFNDQFRETEWERNARLRRARLANPASAGLKSEAKRSDEVAAGKENSQPDTQEAIARTRP